MQPYLALYHVIALQGIFPSRNAADPLLGEIMMVGYNFAPRDWALCDIDTQPNVDFVYFVDGKTAIQENFIAKFIGQNLPPVVVSRTNEVLIWFVTDKTATGQGWEFSYETVE